MVSIPLWIGVFSGDGEEPSESTPTQSVAKAEFPVLKNTKDDILENILRDFFDQNRDAPWWSRIDYIKEGFFGNEVAKIAYIYTDYRLDNVDDVEQATLMCNALVSFVPRDGLIVNVRGAMTEGATRLDGKLETQELTEEPITSGRSWDPGYPEKWCVARTLFTSVIDGLKARGWSRQYTPDLTKEQEKRQYEGAFAQPGKIYMRN